MASPPVRSVNGQTRTYDRASSVVFLKTHEAFGGLSNMAGGFPLFVNGIRIYTSEALYQACRFPQRPEVQWLIIGQPSPMTAKMKSKPYRHDSRPDWDQVRVKVMRWCLRVKLAQNWDAFSKLLLETEDRPIVEESRRDDFWGARPVDEQTLAGRNVLGRLLMELREVVKAEGREAVLRVEPIGIPDFLLGGRPIETVTALVPGVAASIAKSVVQPTRSEASRPAAVQASLFSPSEVREAPPPEYGDRSTKRIGIANLQPYRAMKDSDVSWLGQVPEHWEVKPNRALFEEVKDQNHSDEPLLSVTIARGVVRQSDLLSDTPKKDSSNLDKSKYKLVQPGEIAYNKMRAWQGAVGLSQYRGIISPAYIVQRPRAGVSAEYMHYLLRTPGFAKEAERWSYGISSDQWSLRPEHFKMIYSCLPSPDEQAAIVHFLDHLDGRIRRYIRTKQKLIKLLEEQKQVIIHRAVTRGLAPNMRLKRSGVEWLGEVPEHWEIWQIGHFSRVGNGSTPSRGNSAYWTGGHYPWLNSAYANQESIAHADQFVTDTALRECHLPIVPPSSVLVAITGQGKTRGKAAVLRIEATINQHMAFITPHANIVSADYLRLALHGAYAQLRSISDDSGSTKGALTCADLRHFRLALPPLAEQGVMLGAVEGETRTTSAALDRAQREIALFREYRIRLITDVVTGKFDVREAAARLPAEVEEPELLGNPDALTDTEAVSADDLDAAPVETEA